MQSSPGLRTCFNSSPRAADHSFGSKGSDWTPLASDYSAILPISSLSSAVRGYPWCRVLIMRTCWRCFDEEALLVYACMCVPVGVLEVVGVCVYVCSPSSLVDPLFPRKLTRLGKQKLHSYWPTSHWCINLIGWHILLPHTCCKEWDRKYFVITLKRIFV